MADRQRWLWAVVRLSKRNRWTTFGLWALLSILGAAGVAGVFYLSERSRGPADFFVSFGIMAGVLTLFGLGMALANLRLERRGKAFGPEAAEAAIEALISGRFGPGPSPWPKAPAPPSIRSALIVALLLGALSYPGGSLPGAALVGGLWLLVGLVLRWAWSTPAIPLRRLALAAVAAVLAVFALDIFGPIVGSRPSLTHGIVTGAVVGAFFFGLALLARWFSAPDRHPVLQTGLRVRDRALALALEARTGREAIDGVLEATGGMRAAAEVAWDVLRKRPRDDEVAAQALTLVDQAIRAGDWGWWPWGRRSGP